MSRTEAFRRFTESDIVTQTVGVECRKDRSVLDEIPGAYKEHRGSHVQPGGSGQESIRTETNPLR